MKLSLLAAFLFTVFALSACSDLFIKPDSRPGSPAMIPFEKN